MMISGKKAAFIKGTFILTMTGFINKIIGFFYRIFLSNKIGAEGMGIYQLIFPVVAICHAITIGGLSIAISKLGAEKHALKDEAGAKSILFSGLIISTILSILTGTLLMISADTLAVHIYNEQRCGLLFKILALSLPFSAIHSCICGYYFGKKQTMIPSLSQLVEQVIRVGSVFLICHILESRNAPIDISVAVIGIVIGEIISMLFCLTVFGHDNATMPKTMDGLCFLPLIRLSLPLSFNHLALHLLQSVEAILLPLSLASFGLESSEALQVYGTLTGMALPFILFPSAITNSIATLLLPTIAEAKAANNQKLIRSLIYKSFTLSITFGFLLTAGFLITGSFLGEFFFHSTLAGHFIRTLSFLCPFLCLAITLESILNGLGKTMTSFLHNIIELLIRILFVIFTIPAVGITGYLWGILASEILISLLHLYSLRKS